MRKVLSTLNGCVSVLLYFINTVLLVIPLLFFSLFKLIPIKPWRALMSWVVDSIATLWISNNRLNQSIFSRTKIDVRGNEKLSRKSWYLVISNHQSWVDILVLQRVFNHKIPFLKFFLKKSLIYVPFLGLAWWALDFPFMQRYSRAFLEKKPHLKGKDLATTKKACEKFEYKPVSIMNFVEGTRFSASKRGKDSEFEHLLPPRAGGVAFVLNAMGERLEQLVNVTIFYPCGIPTYWDFICGKVPTIVVDIETLSISSILNDQAYNDAYFTDPAQKQVFQTWMNQLWHTKDAKLKQLQHEYESH